MLSFWKYAFYMRLAVCLVKEEIKARSMDI
jgi:hypothetical protein